MTDQRIVVPVKIRQIEASNLSDEGWQLYARLIMAQGDIRSLRNQLGLVWAISIVQLLVSAGLFVYILIYLGA